MTLRPSLVLVASLALAGCAGTVPTPTPPRAPAEQVHQVPPSQPEPPRPTAGFVPPKVMREPGLGDVIGARAPALERLFGKPRLDTREGDVRKLQFADEACVLDVFLYPMREGGEPEATWVEARRHSDGLEVDRASCVAALRRR